MYSIFINSTCWWNKWLVQWNNQDLKFKLNYDFTAPIKHKDSIKSAAPKQGGRCLTMIDFTRTNTYQLLVVGVLGDGRSLSSQPESLKNTMHTLDCFTEAKSIFTAHQRPSIMAKRSSPLLLELGTGSSASVNSPMIFANSALALLSWKTLKMTNEVKKNVLYHCVLSKPIC